MKRARIANARQRLWHDWLALSGCYICSCHAELHHCVGSSGSHKKIHIGQDFCVPLCPDCHRGNGGIHHSRSVFAGHGLGDTRKQIEKTIFSRLVTHYAHQHGGELPMPADVYQAIMEFHR